MGNRGRTSTLAYMATARIPVAYAPGARERLTATLGRSVSDR